VTIFWLVVVVVDEVEGMINPEFNIWNPDTTLTVRSKDTIRNIIFWNVYNWDEYGILCMYTKTEVLKWSELAVIGSSNNNICHRYLSDLSPLLPSERRCRWLEAHKTLTVSHSQQDKCYKTRVTCK
jgi:hypothetical protein